MRCVGLDLGTTKISAAAIDTEPPPGRLLGVVSREHGAGLSPAQPWEHLQDPERLLAEVARMLGELAAAVPAPAAGRSPWDGLCLTGQMHGVLYADSGGTAVSPLMSWLDGRAGQPHPSGGSWADALSAAIGRRIPPGYGAATHYYNQNRGLVPPRAAFLCTIVDWVTWRLAARSALGAAAAGPVTDATLAASVGLVEPQAGRPDPRVLEAAGLGRVLTPEIVEAGTRVGSTAGGGGVPAGIPLLAPLGDNQAGFLGAVREVEGMALLNVGTGGQVSAWLPAGRAEGRAGQRGRAEGSAGRRSVGLDVRPFPGGGLLLVGATLCAGEANALLEGFFRSVLQAFGCRAEGPLYERMNELAREAGAGGEGGQGPEGLRVDTRFNGTRRDPHLRGAIRGIDLHNLTPARLARGFLEGIVEELAGYCAALERVRGDRLRGLAASGNGLRRNPLLRREAERRFGMRLQLPLLREEAALGAALAAAVGLGCFPGFRAAGRMIRYEGEEDGHG